MINTNSNHAFTFTSKLEIHADHIMRLYLQLKTSNATRARQDKHTDTTEYRTPDFGQALDIMPDKHITTETTHNIHAITVFGWPILLIQRILARCVFVFAILYNLVY